MTRQTDKIEFKSMPKWVVEDFKESLTKDIDKGIIKTMSDAFSYTKGWFSQKDCVPTAVFDFISELNTEGRLQ